MIPGEIRWVRLPSAPDHSQAGQRPAVVLQDDSYSQTSPLVIVAPLTSALGTLRFPGTLLLSPSPGNALTLPSVALVFQVRAVDRSRVEPPAGTISPSQLSEVHTLLDHLLERAAA